MHNLDTIFNTILALLILLIVTRIMGRRSIAQLTYFDYVVGITIGSIASSMATSKVAIHQGAVSIGTSTLCVLIINVIIRYSLFARKIINAEPIMIIFRGQILEDNMRKKYYNVNDLLEQLREKGVFNPDEIEVAVIETDGQLSILRKPQFQPVIAKDLAIFDDSKDPRNSNYIGKELVIAGKIIEKNLYECGITTEWLKNELRARGIEKMEDVVLAIITPQGTLYIDKSNDNVPTNLQT